MCNDDDGDKENNGIHGAKECFLFPESITRKVSPLIAEIIMHGYLV